MSKRRWQRGSVLERQRGDDTVWKGTGPTTRQGLDRPTIEEYDPRLLEPWKIALVRNIDHRLGQFRMRLLFDMIRFCDPRISEVVNLRWRDVDLIEQRWRVRKSKTDEGKRWLPMPRELASRLALYTARSFWAENHDYVFAHPHLGSPLNPEHDPEAVIMALRRIGWSEAEVSHFRQPHDVG